VSSASLIETLIAFIVKQGQEINNWIKNTFFDKAIESLNQKQEEEAK